MTLHLDFGNIGPFEQEAVLNALRSGQISTATPQVQEFERRMAEYLGVSDAVATNSGTAALHLALMSLGIGHGDEVILPVTTFCASANAIVHAGATPVFVDIDIGTWTIDPLLIEESITQRTKAIMPVHLYGNPCHMNEIMDIANEHGLYVIEDAAESLGSFYCERFTGTIGDVGCFSFNGNKTITTSGGGLLVAKDKGVLLKSRALSMQGRAANGKQLFVGYNYRMTGIEASLGIAQIGRINNLLSLKRSFRLFYSTYLDLEFQHATPMSFPSWWYTACLFDEPAEDVQKKLKRNGIPTRRVFNSLNNERPYRNDKIYWNAEFIYKHGLCLPCSTLNMLDDIKRVCDAIEE